MILIGEGRVITRDKNNPLIKKGGVLIDGEKILKVGNYEELKKEFPNAEIIDAKGNLIMPGLINTHEHIYSAFARGLSVKGYNPNGFLDILDGMWWTIDRNLTLDGTYMSAIATYMDCIKNGVTTVFDHHASYGAIEGSLFRIADAADKLGVRTCLCYEVSDRDGMEKSRAAIKENTDFIKYTKEKNSDMVKAMMGMHAQFTMSNETLDLCRKNMPDDVGAHIHVAEGIEDLYDSLHKYGTRIVNRLMDHDILGPKTITAHCIYINEQEMDLLKETDTMVVHNPESNMGNACGCPPTMKIFQKGILTGLGTDGYTHDMYESYKVGNLLHKHSLCDANAAWGEIPSMLFEGNRKMANRYFNAPLGILESGAAADVIVVEYDPVTPLTADNINSHLLFGVNGSMTKTTICNGKVLMKDRELLVIDEAKAWADARCEAKKLADRING
ncbi:MAG: putative aminohydrolase SsnA [Lachnospiraceae bacterium]|jgi:putative selenium metabolism protein SsnA|nr:putative aminohydrolase SsnA [Lachnospiraceae bacterium]